jgi:hypothetical protein
MSAHVCVCGPGRADPRPRVRAYARFRYHHSLHHRQKNETQGIFRGEGVVRVARVNNNRRGNGTASA